MDAKKGFTLIELLVVIGIIGALMAIGISQFGGANETALATKCKANMLNITRAVQNVAQGDENGAFPAAGSFKYSSFYNGKVRYYERHGWVSWSRAPGETAKGGGTTIPFSVSDEEQRQYALTNGAIWSAVGGAQSSYQCPIHAEAFYKVHKRYPAWSYAMNQAFGFDSKYGGGPLPGWSGLSLAGTSNGERLLLFAEIQGRDVDENNVHLKANTEGGGTSGDGVLQYSKSEVIGFNHKISRRLNGHVSFADGHVETLAYPRGGISLTELTEALCQGKELQYDGKQYRVVK